MPFTRTPVSKWWCHGETRKSWVSGEEEYPVTCQLRGEDNQSKAVKMIDLHHPCKHLVLWPAGPRSSEVVCGCFLWKNSTWSTVCWDRSEGGLGSGAWRMGRSWKEGTEREQLRRRELHPGLWGKHIAEADLPDGAGDGAGPSWRGQLRTDHDA